MKTTVETASFVLHGVRVPAFLYGTAWKEERTAALTAQALAAGFRGVDTANQRKHYLEAGVGAAAREFLADKPRDALFLQTKYTYARGQDARLPYDPKATLEAQVRQSFASSCEHLGVAQLDALLLHGPELGQGLTAGDWEVWRAFEALRAEGHVRLLGVSNVRAEQLDALLQGARAPVAFVQNRCYADQGWDRAVRAKCAAAGVRYQGFSLLTANRAVLSHPRVAALARAHRATASQVVFCFAQRVGMLPLTGSSDPAHLREDLESAALALTDDDVRALEGLVG